MKKLALILAVVMLATVSMKSEAQVTSFTGTTTNPTIAISGSTVDTAMYSMSGLYNAKVTFQVLVNKTSGTMAGTVRLYGSNYVNTVGAWEPVSDTLTLTNSTTNKKTWELVEPCYKYYMVLQGGGSSVVGVMQVKVFGIKPN